MTIIFAYPGEASPTVIKASDPTVLRGGGAVVEGAATVANAEGFVVSGIVLVLASTTVANTTATTAQAIVQVIAVSSVGATTTTTAAAALQVLASSTTAQTATLAAAALIEVLAACAAAVTSALTAAGEVVESDAELALALFKIALMKKQQAWADADRLKRLPKFKRKRVGIR